MMTKKVSRRSLVRTAALALGLAAAVGGWAVAPALADDWHHDQRQEQHWRDHDRRDHDRDHDRRDHHPVRYAPPAYVEAPPVVYAPPPPPPAGINIVIPLQFR